MVKNNKAEIEAEARKELIEGEPHDFDDFVEVVARLRAPDGCVWDRAQTHESLKKYLIEETQDFFADRTREFVFIHPIILL